MTAVRWSQDIVRQLAAGCSSPKAFERLHPGAYEAALKRLKIVDELFPDRRVPWNLVSLRAEAAKYQTKIDFKRGSGSAYRAAARLGLLDQLGLVNQFQSWDEARVRQAASEYETAVAMIRGDLAAYAAAKRLGLLGDLGFVHQDGKDNDTIYIWRAVGQYFNGEPIYKIGVTSARLGSRRIDQVAKDVGFEYVLICCEPVACRATDLEKRLHLLGHDPQFTGFDGATEFRAMSDAVLWVALGLISEVAMRKP